MSREDEEREEQERADRVLTLARRGDLDDLTDLVRSTPPSRQPDLVSALPTTEAAIVLRLLPKGDAVRVYDAVDSALQAELISELGQARVADFFDALDPEEQARLLEEVPARIAQRMLRTIEPGKLGPALSLLGYPQNSVGRRMSPVAVRAHAEDAAGDVLDRVRVHDEDLESLVLVPVLAADRTLIGAVELTALVRADRQRPVGDLMHEPHAATTFDDAEHVATEALREGSPLVWIVDSEDRLVGVLPLADAARIHRDAATEDQARAGGTEPLSRPYLLTPLRQLSRARVVWLLVLAISAVLTVQVLEIFEATLEQQVTLALFIPLLTGIGGNTGAQAATTVTRALAMGELNLRDIGRVAWKEVRTGGLLGFVLALIAMAATSLVYDPHIGAVIALTLLLNCPIAALVGGVVPLVARGCRVDPAVVSTPFISTFCDASGLVVYFSVAILVLGL